MANLRKQVDVSNFIARIFELLLNLLLPASERRQRARRQPAGFHWPVAAYRAAVAVR